MTRALRGRDGKESIQLRLWHVMPVGRLLGTLVAGAMGWPGAAREAREDLEALAQSRAGDPESSPLFDVLQRILNGDRDPGLADELSYETGSPYLTGVPPIPAPFARPVLSPPAALTVPWSQGDSKIAHWSQMTTTSNRHPGRSDT